MRENHKSSNREKFIILEDHLRELFTIYYYLINISLL